MATVISPIRQMRNLRHAKVRRLARASICSGHKEPGPESSLPALYHYRTLKSRL